MTPIYALCLSASMSTQGLSVRATIAVSEDGRSTTADLEWPKVELVMDEVNAVEWTYKVLERLMEGFDEHLVEAVHFAPGRSSEEDTTDEA